MKKQDIIGFILIISLAVLSIYKHINIQQYSSVLNEINELTQIESGTVVSDLNVEVEMIDSENYSFISNILNGTLKSKSYKLRLKSQFESDKKIYTEILVSTDDGHNYDKLTSVFKDDKKIYIDVKQLLDRVKDESIIDYSFVEKYARQFGIEKYALINLNGLSGKQEENSDDFFTCVIKNLDDSFTMDEYKKGDRYGLKINKKNTGKLIESACKSSDSLKKIKDIILKFNPTIDGEIKTIKNSGIYNSDFSFNVNGKTDYMKFAIKTNSKVIQKNIRVSKSINDSDATDVTVLVNMFMHNLK